MKTRVISSLALSVLASTLVSAQQTAKPTATAPNPVVAPGAKQTEPAKPSAPAQDPTATTSTTPAPPAQKAEDKSVNANKQSQLPQSDGAGVASLDQSGITSAELQKKIEAALASEPTLSGSNLTVEVTDDTINVSGNVGTGKERTMASRIVQSFGENRKVKEKITVSGLKK
jgi:hypothetical protein